ncbi:unnamed protein product [Heterobilharzia americana]|nr:unnamed protein product [Heterobilharzia americana]
MQNSKQKRRRTKFIDSTLKELPQNTSNDEKFDFICQKYYDLFNEQKENLMKNKQFEQNLQQLRVERDQLQNECNRLVLQKDKLETLCRELQKQNKIIQEESLSRARAEDEKRREVSDHFQTSITGIQNQLCEYQSKNLELRKENQDLAEKLGEFIKQHEKREEHVDKLMQTRSLELKLSEAKLNKAQCLLDQEKAKGQQKILQLEEEVKFLRNRLDIQKTIEEKLKEQIAFYKEKYQSFNKTMSESRKMFDNAKEEMEKLGKRIHLSEREAVEWQGKWEVSQRSLLELAEQHKEEKVKSASAKKQVEKLSGLCRALQSQLDEYRQQQKQKPQEEQAQQNEQIEGKKESHIPMPNHTVDNQQPEINQKLNGGTKVNVEGMTRETTSLVDEKGEAPISSNGSEAIISSPVSSSTHTFACKTNSTNESYTSDTLSQCTENMDNLKLNSDNVQINSNFEVHPLNTSGDISSNQK